MRPTLPAVIAVLAAVHTVTIVALPAANSPQLPLTLVTVSESESSPLSRGTLAQSPIGKSADEALAAFTSNANVAPAPLAPSDPNLPLNDPVKGTQVQVSDEHVCSLRPASGRTYVRTRLERAPGQSAEEEAAIAVDLIDAATKEEVDAVWFSQTDRFEEWDQEEEWVVSGLMEDKPEWTEEEVRVMYWCGREADKRRRRGKSGGV